MINPDLGNLTLPANIEGELSVLLQAFLKWDTIFLTDSRAIEKVLVEMNELIKHVAPRRILSSEGVAVKGPLLIGDGVCLMPGTIIEGPCIIGENAKIGPNAFLRPGAIVGAQARVGFGVEIKASCLMDNSSVHHLAYIGHSLIGERARLGAGVIMAARRLDDDYIKLSHPTGLIDTRHRKLGGIIEKNANIGVGVAVMPGTWISGSARIMPMQSVRGYVDS